MAAGIVCVATPSVVALIVSENCWLTLCAEASVTFTVKFEVPIAVGVPLSAPAEESDIPAGRDPADTVKTNGASPPEVLMLALYGVPIVPAASVDVVIESVAAFTVSVNCREAFCAEPSATCAVKAKLPTTVGVPERTPPEESVTPAGKLPAETDQV